jgi:hypothetical protein
MGGFDFSGIATEFSSRSDGRDASLAGAKSSQANQRRKFR